MLWYLCEQYGYYSCSYGPVFRYLGLYDTEEDAARAYDRAIIDQKGRGAKTNFPLDTYEGLLANINKPACELV